MSAIIKTKYHEKFEISTGLILVKPCDYSSTNFTWHSYTYEGLRFNLCIFQYKEAIDRHLVGRWGGIWIVSSEEAYQMQRTKNIPMTVWYSCAAITRNTGRACSTPEEALLEFTSDVSLFERGSIGKVYHLADNIQPINPKEVPMKVALRSHLLHLGFFAMRQITGF